MSEQQKIGACIQCGDWNVELCPSGLCESCNEKHVERCREIVRMSEKREAKHGE